VWVIESYSSHNSSGVDYNTAASASCIRPVVFKSILGTVQDLVEIDSLKSRTEEYDSKAATHAELMQAFRPRQYRLVLLGWFESAEPVLLGIGEVRDSDLKPVKNLTLLRCVVFAWAFEVSRVRSSTGVSQYPNLNLDSRITSLMP
jgi:hypothetical protein